PPYVYLPSQQPDHSGFIRLSTDALRPWMAALLELVGDRTHDFSGDTLKLSRLDAMRTTASLGEGAVWDGALALREMVQGLSGRTALPEVAVPAGMNATLRPYQQQGLNWLQFLRTHALSGILADDMGLGKTLQTLAHIQVEKDAGRLTHPALIIAPVSLMGNWRKEAERFCPGLRALVIHGKDRHEVADSMAEFDVVIAPYSLLQRDKDRWLEARWHIVVLDEAQNIKNASTHAAQVAGQLQTTHRLCLSGTPMENHLGEIWSLFHFLMPGFLGSQKRFTELFRTPIEKQGNSERLQQLRARITPFMLRRTKALVATELPPKVEIIQRVALTGKQADLYETIRLGMEKTVREALSSKGLAKSQITILDALLKLRQVCCDPQLLKLPAAQKVKTSAKLEHLMELLPEMVAEGRRILLFSQFTSMLTLIEAELKARGIAWVKLTGASQNRDALIEQFTSGQVPVFLISLKAGGVGLNLPQADTVIHYDPWWNPAAENQATDRAHRIGQTHTVFVHKLVAQGTIEERILDLQARKAALAEGMYSGSTGRKEPLFTEGDLAELLRPLSET
ncbi:MAG: DEAD/DEAH box helicase, partial [Candidatus Saccharibacteria bacterium]|nr:DEAD/DEAH box helicase [Rhodoferax sp.]